MSSEAGHTVSLFAEWFESLREKDEQLYEELSARLQRRAANPEAVHPPGSEKTLESVAVGSEADLRAVVLETIVRDGRPALLIRDNRIAPEGKAADTAAAVVINRLREASPRVEPLIPLVGRIDVQNHPVFPAYVGTGWLIDRNVVVTNRHVAELIARSEDGKFSFRPGRFGEELRVAVDYRHEHQREARAVSRVRRVIWIETNPQKADFALLEVERRTDGTTPEFIPLAEADASPNSDVAVVGYPARAPAHVIPDQAWMDQIYGSTYDVKRIAPGLMGANSRGWATHDCTTLGGNSGGVVIDTNTGRAAALHFAGLYMIENYAVPASTLRTYLKSRPWHPESASSDPRRAETQTDPAGPRQPAHGPAPGGGAQSPAAGAEVRTDGCQVSMTIPLTVTVSLGTPQLAAPSGGTSQTAPPAAADAGASGATPPPAPPGDIEEAARSLHRAHGGASVYAVWPGYRIRQGRLTEEECLVVSAHPDRLEDVRKAVPSAYGRFPVEVRRASVERQVEALTEAPVTSVRYNDEDRTGSGFSFNWVEEEMDLLLHVGPERSWPVLREFLGAAPQEYIDFLGGAPRELVSSIYEFHAAHIADAVERGLRHQQASMTLVLARQSRDPRSGKIPKGDFDRSETFARWENNFRDRFDRVFVPLGAQGLVANSYHIKVTVRDGSHVWLSSGNWKRTSQPLIPEGGLQDPRVTAAAGNREWHVVVRSPTLAERFRNHILADFEQSKELGGTPEAVGEELMVDVPESVLEAAEFEAPPERVVEPLKISRRVRVKPLLTPDRQGAVYSRAVLQLINSARKQLLFQNQYIKMSGADGGFLKQLVDALGDRARRIKDFRIILRSGNEDQDFDLTQLQRRGVDVHRQVKILDSTHTKGIIVDGRRVLVGSHNWSSSGVTLNRDASLIFDDEEVAQYYATAFELDWERAREPRFEEPVNESVRLAEGAQPPPGYVRLSLSDYLEG